MAEEEILQVFDDQRTPIAEIPRSVVKADPRIHWYGVINVWLVNKGGEILCTKRSDTVKNNPGKWQTFAGGHLKAGQSYVDAAIAELDEELGLKIDPSKLVLMTARSNTEILCHFENLAYPLDVPSEEVEFPDGEIVEANWMSIGDYFADKTASPEKWCNGISDEGRDKLVAWIEDGRPTV